MSTAFFPGKFHPPHIGHVQTILDILPDYDKVIIGVTERAPVDNPTAQYCPHCGKPLA